MAEKEGAATVAVTGGVTGGGAGDGTSSPEGDGDKGIDFLSEIGQSVGDTAVKAAQGAGDATPAPEADKGKTGDGKEGPLPEGGDVDKDKDKDKDEPVVDEKDAEITRLKEENERLKNAGPAKSPEPPEPIIKPEMLAVDFIADDKEFDEAFEKRESMNKLLQKVLLKGLETSLTTLPKVIDKIVKDQVIVYAKSVEWWKRNKDIKEHAKFVGEVIDDMVSKDPSLRMDDLFGTDEAPGKLDTEVRKRLKLTEKAKEKEVKKEQQRERPAFAKGAGVRTPVAQTPVLSPLEEDIKNLIE